MKPIHYRPQVGPLRHPNRHGSRIALVVLLLVGMLRAASVKDTLSPAAEPRHPWVQSGRTVAMIVLPAKPEMLEGYAAGELQKYVKEITGRILPIINEPEKPEGFGTYNEPQKLDGYGIWLGKTKAAEWAHFTRTEEKLGRDGYAAQADEHGLIVVGYSNRFAILNNEVARRVAQRFPKVTIRVFAYGFYLSPPDLKDFRVEPNLQVVFTRIDDRSIVDQWAALAGQLGAYQYYALASWGKAQVLRGKVSEMRNDIPWLRDRGVKAFYTQSMQQPWPQCPFNYYIAAKQNGSHGIFGGIIDTVARCHATLNAGFGISVSETGLIEKCNLNNNTGGGISVTNFSVVRENICDFHTTNPGIAVAGADNRIEGNNVTRNARGIDLGASGNLVIKNSASGSTGAGTPSANYDFNGFTQTNGAIITATGTIAADSWANFSF